MAVEPDATIWSNTDYPYLCLVDRRRTLAFREAIEASVRPGDVVVEVGAGTGILSLFAAAAGASEVHAVEIDPVLARALVETAAANGYADVVRVVPGDARTAELPQRADVVIGELVETGLLDEMQVAVMNALHHRGVIGPGTRVVPATYSTYVQLAETDDRFYGFTVCAPKHEWPYYAQDPEQWEHLRWTPVSERVLVTRVDLAAGPVDPVVRRELDLVVAPGRTATALVLSGVAGLAPGTELGATNSFSGDKVLPLTPCTGPVRLRVTCTMGAGLDDLTATVL